MAVRANRTRRFRRSFVTGLFVVVLLVALPSLAAAARPIVNEHLRFTETFPEEICGIPGTSEIRVVDNFKLYADGTFLDTAQFRNVFTATRTGKQVQIFSAGQTRGLDQPIDNGEGTITFVATFKGMPEKLSIFHGPTLLRDAGNVTVRTTFRENADGSVTLVSRDVTGEKGPHPDLDSGFEAFCNVLVPALS
jgi:hypothetical protein